jgi:GH15 family glucan-1,4-alpha-glucosidase
MAGDGLIAPNKSANHLDVASIGNGRIAALVNRTGRIVWCCFPRLDGDPVFSSLLAKDAQHGFSDVMIDNFASSSSSYLRNSAILETILRDTAGNAVRVLDFMPRFRRFERIFHPPQHFRRIEPLHGLPRVTIRFRPSFDYGGPCLNTSVGSSHIRYSGAESAIRLTTDASLSYVEHETPFALTRPVTLILGPDEPFEGSVDFVSREFLERTHIYWLEWVRALGVPLEWQTEVIRAAITLELCSFDETGAIIAAQTTSIPESPGSGRNWDYRFCWIRDAYFVIKALNRLGATRTMEAYLNYITSIAVDGTSPLRPVYGIVPNQPLDERIAPNLDGFMGMGPVRIGNQAAEQVQHDSYGNIILASSQMFIDERLPRVGDIALFRQLEPLGEQARGFAMEPDAGLWEYRGRKRIHTHSATMCWVACDRLSRIAHGLGLPDRARYWRGHAKQIKDAILSRAWSRSRDCIAGALDHSDLDASVLLLPELGLISASDERFIKTVNVIGRELNRNGYLLRYDAEDDFGAPENAFLVCQFWYIDALALIGRKDEARELFTDLIARRNSYGILSEDIDPASKQLWGNLPQTYSMAGVINSARSLSRKWEEAWAID